MTALSLSNFLTFKNRRFLPVIAAGIFILLVANADMVRAPLYGDGSDDDVTIAGLTVLTADMYYNKFRHSRTSLSGIHLLFPPLRVGEGSGVRFLRFLCVPDVHI